MTATASFQLAQQHTALVISLQPPRAAKLVEAAAAAGWATIVCADTEQAIAFLNQDSKLEMSAVLFDDAGQVEPVNRLVGHVKRRNPNSVIIVTGTGRHDEWALETNGSDIIYHCANVMEVSSIAQLLHGLRRDKSFSAQDSNGEDPYERSGFGFAPLLSEDATFRTALSLAKINANNHLSVSLEGELGTGRRSLAHVIHYASKRRGLPIRSLIVRDTSQEALDVSLFGHERDAFVGAFHAQAGILEQCHRGTLIVEGIDLLPKESQDRLADALAKKQVQPLGTSALIDADVRLLAVSERSLNELAQQGLYSEKLLEGSVLICLPPLRERRGDIGLIADHFLRLIGPIFGLPGLTIDKAAIEALTECYWRGNVRELQAVLCHAAAFARLNVITFHDIAQAMCKGRVAVGVTNHESNVLGEGTPFHCPDGNLRSLADIEKDVIEMALKIYGGSMTKAASRLGIGRSTLYRKLANRAWHGGSPP